MSIVKLIADSPQDAIGGGGGGGGASGIVRFLKLLTSRAKKFNFQKYKDFFFGRFFLFFFELGLKSALGSYFLVKHYIVDV